MLKAPYNLLEWKMRNINTPEDYRELLAYMEKGKVK